MLILTQGNKRYTIAESGKTFPDGSLAFPKSGVPTGGRDEKTSIIHDVCAFAGGLYVACIGE